MGQSYSAGAIAVRESISNFPLPAKKRAFLEALFQNGGEATQAARIAFPDHLHPDVKGSKLRKELSPYIKMAALEYTEQLRPVALGVVVQLMKGEIADTPPAVRLKAAEVVLERADRMVPQEEGGTRGKDTLDGLIRLVLTSVGAELAKQLLASKGIPVSKIDEVLAQLTGPKVVNPVEEVEHEPVLIRAGREEQDGAAGGGGGTAGAVHAPGVSERG